MSNMYVAVVYPPNDFPQVVRVGEEIHTIGPAFHSPEEAARQLAKEFDDIYANDLDLTGFIIEVDDGIVQDYMPFDPKKHGYRTPNPNFAGMAPFMFSTAEVAAQPRTHEQYGGHHFARIPTTPPQEEQLPYTEPASLDTFEERILTRVDEKLDYVMERFEKAAEEYRKVVIDSDTKRGKDAKPPKKPAKKSFPEFSNSKLAEMVTAFVNASGDSERRKIATKKALPALANYVGIDIDSPQWQNAGVPVRRDQFAQRLEEMGLRRAAAGTDRPTDKPVETTDFSEDKPVTPASKKTKGRATQYTQQQIDEYIRLIADKAQSDSTRAAGAAKIDGTSIPKSALKAIGKRLGIADVYAHPEVANKATNKSTAARRFIAEMALKWKESGEPLTGAVPTGDAPKTTGAKRTQAKSDRATQPKGEVPSKKELESVLEMISGKSHDLSKMTALKAAQILINGYKDKSNSKETKKGLKALLRALRLGAGQPPQGQFGPQRTSEAIAELYKIPLGETSGGPESAPKADKRSEAAKKAAARAAAAEEPEEDEEITAAWADPANRLLALILVRQAGKSRLDGTFNTVADFDFDSNTGKFEGGDVERVAKLDEQGYQDALMELIRRKKIKKSKLTPAAKEKGHTAAYRLHPDKITSDDLEMLAEIGEEAPNIPSSLIKRFGLEPSLKPLARLINDKRMKQLKKALEADTSGGTGDLTPAELDALCVPTVADAKKILPDDEMELIDEAVSEQILHNPLFHQQLQRNIEDKVGGSKEGTATNKMVLVTMGLWGLKEGDDASRLQMNFLPRDAFGKDLKDKMGAYLIRKGYYQGKTSCMAAPMKFVSIAYTPKFKSWKEGKAPTPGEGVPTRKEQVERGSRGKVRKEILADGTVMEEKPGDLEMIMRLLQEDGV